MWVQRLRRSSVFKFVSTTRSIFEARDDEESFARPIMQLALIVLDSSLMVTPSGFSLNRNDLEIQEPSTLRGVVFELNFCRDGDLRVPENSVTSLH